MSRRDSNDVANLRRRRYGTDQLAVTADLTRVRRAFDTAKTVPQSPPRLRMKDTEKLEPLPVAHHR